VRETSEELQARHECDKKAGAQGLEVEATGLGRKDKG
jgi:hypothetical protein